MDIKKVKLTILATAISAGLCGCATPPPPEIPVSAPAQQQAKIIKKYGGVYKVGNPYKVLGRWYYPKEDYSYSEVGTASWYGPDFHAKKTANGEQYNMHALTAAHRTLPLPSIVKVTNLENGRSLLVRVNDRGPYARDRIIDISRKGAQLLGFIDKGTAKVRVEVMEKESRNLKAALTGCDPVDEAFAAPSTVVVRGEIGDEVPVIPAVKPVARPASVPAKAYAGSGRYYIQAGAFASRESAVNLSSRLQQFGSSHVSEADVNGSLFYRVRVGPFSHHEEAIVAQSKIRNFGIPAAHIIED